MRARQSDILETARKVQTFLTANAAVLGPTILPAQQNLNDAVDQLTVMATTQSSTAIAAKGATAQQRALRATLRKNYMKPVATIAKLMVPDVPEIHSLANTAKNLSTPQLVAAAHAMADAADKYPAVFTGNGLTSDFTNQIRNAADAVTTAVLGRQQLVQTTSGAVSGLLQQEGRLRSLIKLLNALVVPKLGTNATLLAQWKSARAITNQSSIAAVPASVTAAATAGAVGAPTTPALGDGTPSESITAPQAAPTEGTSTTTAEPSTTPASTTAPAAATTAPSQGS